MFFGCFSAGLIKLTRERNRIHALEAVCGALGQMRIELSTRLAPIPELAGMLARRGQGDAQHFFAALCARLTDLGQSELSTLWSECAETKLFALDADELKDFIAIGRILGRGELSSQLAAIAQCEVSLNRALAEARAGLAEKRRLTLGVFSAAGLLLVIMLI